MNYSNIISDFTWSYSRLTCFENCPYQFFLSYIKQVPKKHLFFSDYGSLMHSILELRLKGKLSDGELVGYYLQNFRKEVKAQAPNRKIFQTYFQDGLNYLTDFIFPYDDILGVEVRSEFQVGGKNFVGVVDCVAGLGNLTIAVDHKSRILKPMSRRQKPTKSDLELSAKLRQLQLYGMLIKDQFHKYPDRLDFNCFRSGEIISCPFDHSELETTKQWALDTIDRITYNDNWKPNMDYWKCRYLCDCSDHCEYYQTNRG